MIRCVLLPLATVLMIMVTPLHADTGTDGVWTALQPNDLNVVQSGRKIYKAQCAACHGLELQGQPDWQKPDASNRLPAPPHDASGHTWHHSDDLLFEITKYGPAAAAEMPRYQSNMPAYENILSDDDIVAVLSYIKSNWPKKERDWQDGLNGGQDQNASMGGVSTGLLAQLTGKAKTKHAANGEAHKQSARPAAKTPLAVVNEFAAALNNGDSKTIEQLVAASVVIFEEGGVEQSFAEYQRSHLAADIKFMARVNRTVKEQQVIHQAELAVVLTQSELKGKAGSKAHVGMVETMILQRAATGWKIVHIHWSSKIL